jgi:hypothetical protein
LQREFRGPAEGREVGHDDAVTAAERLVVRAVRLELGESPTIVVMADDVNALVRPDLDVAACLLGRVERRDDPPVTAEGRVEVPADGEELSLFKRLDNGSASALGGTGPRSSFAHRYSSPLPPVKCLREHEEI